MLYKLAMVRDFTKAEGGFQPDADPDQPKKQRDLLIVSLGHSTWTDLQWSKLLVREMVEGWFREDIHQQITGNDKIVEQEERTQAVSNIFEKMAVWAARWRKGPASEATVAPVPKKAGKSRTWGARIEISASKPQPFQAVQLRVILEDVRKNACAARKEITPVWKFGSNLEERGWAVAHYFAEKRVYPVEVHFIDRTSGWLLDRKNGNRFEVAGEITVDGPQKTRFIFSRPAQLGWARFAIALLPAVLGLYSGANEQLAKLEVIPGLIAIFMLGFTSDQVKNMLIKQN